MIRRTSLPARSSVLPRSTKPIPKRKPVKKVNPKRKAKTLARCYGPPARRKWMKAQPCVVCVMLLPVLRYVDKEWRCDQAHVEGDGASHKAAYTKTVPMCRNHHRWYDTRYDFLGGEKIRQVIIGAAATYEAAWLAYSTGEAA